MVSNFEIETQQQLNWCWAAVAATVSRYFSPHQALEQCQIASRVLKVADGCANPSSCDFPETLDDALAAVDALAPGSLNRQRVQAPPRDFKTVKLAIDSGRPVCVQIEWFGGRGGHYVMLG